MSECQYCGELKKQKHHCAGKKAYFKGYTEGYQAGYYKKSKEVVEGGN